jgi:hypothetical protein
VGARLIRVWEASLIKLPRARIHVAKKIESACLGIIRNLEIYGSSESSAKLDLKYSMAFGFKHFLIYYNYYK